MASISNLKDVKYSRLENNNTKSTYQPIPVNSSGFGRTVKFVCILAAVIILFTCTTWAFRRPDSPSEQEGVHSVSYEKTEIIFSQESQGHLENVKGDSTTDTKENNEELVLGGTIVQTVSGNSQRNQTTESQVIIPNAAVKSKGSAIKQKQPEIITLFSTLHSTFDDIKLGKDNWIPTLQFIQASSDLKPLLERIGSTVSMIENDLKGNAEKVKTVYNRNPDTSQALQDMLLNDIKRGKIKDDGSSTIALLWIKRAYQFIERFLRYVAEGKQPVNAALTAYDEKLSRYHGFFIRNAFKIGMNLLPSRTDFMRKMIMNKQDIQRPDYEAKVVSDMKKYLDGMVNIFNILEDFYRDHKLET